MVLGYASLLLSFLAVASYLWLGIVLAYLLSRHHIGRTLPESIVGAALLIFIGLLAQIHLLSFLPLPRPLDYLWGAHLLMIVAVTMIARRSGMVAFRGWCGQVLARCRIFCRGQPWWMRVLIIALALHLLYFAVHGFLTQSYDWDGLEYHLPMAIQPFQDGRLGPLGSNLPWIDHYPRGVALIWYHTLELTGSTALFLPVQWLGGVLLATTVLAIARRMGGRQDDALIGAVVILTMPLFGLLSRSSYIDLPVAWAALAVVLFLTPTDRSRGGGPADYLLALVAFAVAMQMKLPIIPGIYAVIALLHILLFRGREERREVLGLLRSRGFYAALVLLLCAAYPYLKNLLQFGNPLYPVGATLPFGIRLEGPLTPDVFEQYARTSFGSVEQLGRLGRYPAAWLDLFQTPNPDAFGMTGPAFAFAIIFLFMVFAIHALRHGDSWRIAVSIMCLSIFLLGSLALPRYQLPMTALAIASAVCLPSRWPRDLASSARIAIAILCAFSALSSISFARREYQWARGVLGEDYSLLGRLAPLPEKNRYGYDWYATPQMTTRIRELSGDGMTLAWNVQTYASLLWNTDYSNRIVHIQGSPSETYPGSPAELHDLSPEELTAWYARVLEIRPDHLLLYANSSYARFLESMEDGPFTVVFREPRDDDRWSMVLYGLRPTAFVPAP